jgi:hypothetical protein
VHEVKGILGSKSRRQLKTMVMSSNILSQRYVGGRSLLRNLPLFNTMNATLNPRAACPSRFKSAASKQRRRAVKL